MAEYLDKWPSEHRKTEKSGGRMDAEKSLFPRRWYGGYDLSKPGGHLGNVALIATYAIVPGRLAGKNEIFRLKKDDRYFSIQDR